MQRSPPTFILRIHTCAFCNKKFGDFLVTLPSCPMQWGNLILCLLGIHIRTFGD